METGKVRMGENDVGYMILFSIVMIIGRMMARHSCHWAFLASSALRAWAVLEVRVGPKMGQFVLAAELGDEVTEEASEDRFLRRQSDLFIGRQIVCEAGPGVKDVGALFNDHGSAHRRVGADVGVECFWGLRRRLIASEPLLVPLERGAVTHQQHVHQSRGDD